MQWPKLRLFVGLVYPAGFARTRLLVASKINLLHVEIGFAILSIIYENMDVPNIYFRKNLQRDAWPL